MRGGVYVFVAGVWPALIAGVNVKSPGRAATAIVDPTNQRFTDNLLSAGTGPLEAGPARSRRFYLLTTEPIVPGVRSFLKISPPFMTNFTRRVSEMSATGSPETATMSANLPFVIDPT